MFCPKCRCEYRSGFDTCADCAVPLVDDLASAPPSPQEPAPRPRPSGPMLDYCGYFDLDEARGARDLLRGERIVAEIAIREAPDSPVDGPIREEYWIRFAASDLRVAQALLGFDEAAEEHSADGGSQPCPACGAELAAGESFCGRCGARPGERRG
jgi:hypothetical protein